MYLDCCVKSYGLCTSRVGREQHFSQVGAAEQLGRTPAYMIPLGKQVASSHQTLIWYAYVCVDCACKSYACFMTCLRQERIVTVQWGEPEPADGGRRVAKPTRASNRHSAASRLPPASKP